MGTITRNSQAWTAAVLISSAALAGSASGQVTWQEQTVFETPGPGNDGTCWPSYPYCWQGSGYCCPFVFNSGQPQWLGFDASDRPILAGQLPLNNFAISFVATPSGANTWEVYNSGMGVPLRQEYMGRLGVNAMALDVSGAGYAVTCTASTVCFEHLSFIFHTSPSNVLIQDICINHYQNSIKPQTAIVRPNRGSAGAHWVGATTIDLSGSTCELGRLYFDGTRIDYNLNGGHWGQTVSYDFDTGPDGQSTIVAEFFDVNCDPAVNPHGLYFARTPGLAWQPIAPFSDGGERGVKVAVDGLGVIHVFGARYSQSSGAGGPILHWVSTDNGATWSAQPEQVIPYLTFRDLYAVAASDTGTVGVAYWTSPAMQELRFVEKRCGVWTEYTGLGTAGTGSSSLKVAYDSQDRPHIAHFEKPQDPALGTWKVVSASTGLSAMLADSNALTICPTAPITATVLTTGGGTIAFQWQAKLPGTGWVDLTNGSNPSNNGSGGNFDVAGADGATVTITGLADSAGDYPYVEGVRLRCVVSNLCESVTSDLKSITICPGDFNCDGFVSGGDFDEFVQAFETGVMTADFDADGFITGSDFDLYVQAFEVGC